jgi:putative sigma-54 modulation protein
MKINIKATGIELTPAISEYVHKKVAALDKYFPNPDTVLQLEVGRSTQHHKTGEVFKAEVHAIGGGVDLYAVSEHVDLYAAIDTVRDDIVRNASHEKGKREALTRRGARMMKNALKGLNIFKRRS